LTVERDSQFNTAGVSEFQVRGAAVLKDRLANDVRRNGTHSSGTDDDRDAPLGRAISHILTP